MQVTQLESMAISKEEKKEIAASLGIPVKNLTNVLSVDFWENNKISDPYEDEELNRFVQEIAPYDIDSDEEPEFNLLEDDTGELVITDEGRLIFVKCASETDKNFQGPEDEEEEDDDDEGDPDYNGDTFNTAYIYEG